MEDIFARYIQGAVNEVLTTMASLTATQAGAPFLKSDQTKSLGDISVIIGFSGETVRGTFILHYSRPMAFLLLDKIFATQADDITEELLDAVGEVTNMICGKIKTDVVNAGIPEFNITVPTIIVGKDFQTHIKMSDVATIFPFRMQDETQSLNIELKVKRLK